jgi:hypothetical protein
MHGRDEKCKKKFGQKSRRPRDRWEDYIIIDLREIGWEVVDWMHLTQNRDQS